EGAPPVRSPLGKRAEFREAPHQDRTGVHGWDGCSPKALPERGAVQGLNVSSEYLRRLPIVVEGPKISIAQVIARGHLQASLPQGRSYGRRPLGGRQRTVRVTPLPQTRSHIASELRQPTRIVEGLGQRFRLMQVLEGPPNFAEGDKYIAQVEAEINGLGGCCDRRGDAGGPPGPAQRTRPLPGGLSVRSPWPPPAGSRGAPCPTPRPAGHDAPDARPARPPGLRGALQGPRRSGHAAPAAAPGEGCCRPPRE